jgi:hypothetical protein
MSEINSILVFKTNVADAAALEKVGAILDNEALVDEWNIDMEDIDKVLRINSDLNSGYIIGLLTSKGFICSELE